jgi:penicillin-binding protein 2
MKFDDRKYVLIGAVLFISLVFIIRLFYIQVVDDGWKVEAADISQRRVTIFPSRGLVFDRKEKLLVANTPVYDLMVLPREVEDLDTIAFCTLVGVDKDELIERLTKAKKYSRYKSSIFEKQIPADQYAQMAVHLHKFKGFYGQSRTLRTYPQHTGAHMLGYISEVSQKTVDENPYYRPGDMIGVAGLERSYEEDLRGKRGVKYVVVDVHNTVKGVHLGGAYDTAAVDGKNLYTTLDADLQAYGERLMKGKKGSIIAIDPKTGGILTMVSAPDYDPELLVGRVRNKNYRMLQQDPSKPLFNRTLQAKYPPGSIYKIVQALIGMEEGVIDSTTGFPCIKTVVGCHNHPHPYDVSHAIQYSCNPYFYSVFKRIIQRGDKENFFEDAAFGLHNWHSDMLTFGLGKRLGIDLPNVKAGSIPDTDLYDRMYGKNRWAFSTIRSISIGQGEVEVIPLQMANLACIFANKGYYIDPHVVRAVGTPDNELTFERHETSAGPEWYNLVQEAMRTVVEEPGGTARRARIKGTTVCGKTGTAENPHGKDHSVFIAFAPKENPKIAIATYVENAGFGGTWAAPISRLMMEQYLNDSIQDPLSEKRILEANFIDLPE